MNTIQRKEFKSIPAQTEAMQTWLSKNNSNIEIVGETRGPYRSRTKSGKLKATNIETITIYYREK